MPLPISADECIVGAYDTTNAAFKVSLTVESVEIDITGDHSDLDSGAGTDNHEIFGIGVAASGGHAVITGDVTNGLDVDVTRLPALAAGTANIGDVDVLTIAAGDNNIGNVDIASIAAGDNNIGNVDLASAIPAGTNNIGDVDVLTIAAGDNNIGNVDIVTMPDATVVGKVADGAAVSGNPVLIAGSDGTLAQTISTDVNGRPNVNVVDALPAGTNAIGKLAANSGVDIGDVTLTANSGVDIGDVDVASVIPGTGASNLGKAEDSAHTSADVGVMSLGVRTDVPNAVGAGTTGEYSFLATDMAGGVRTALYETDFAVLGTNHVKKYYTNAGAVTDGIIWSPAAGKRFYVTDIFINVSAAATITLEDDLAGGDSPIWKAQLAANSGWSHSFTTPLFSGEDAADLIITTDAGNVYVTVTGYEI